MYKSYEQLPLINIIYSDKHKTNPSYGSGFGSGPGAELNYRFCKSCVKAPVRGLSSSVSCEKGRAAYACVNVSSLCGWRVFIRLHV